MKACVLFIALWSLMIHRSAGEIKNGYRDIAGARASLNSIRMLIDQRIKLSLLERESMKRKRNLLIRYITYYELTERLLVQFKNISGNLYDEIDSLKDAKGRVVAVYVRFVDEKDLTPGVAGTTNIEQDKDDLHSYRSEYGANTVSVTIAVNRKSMSLLAHELGHVQYQVQNLSSYMVYYNKSYGEGYKRLSVGHNDKDASGKKAAAFINVFHDQLARSMKLRTARPKSHLIMLREIKKGLKPF